MTAIPRMMMLVRLCSRKHGMKYLKTMTTFCLDYEKQPLSSLLYNPNLPDLQALADLPGKCQPVAQGHTHSKPARTHRRRCQQRDKYQPHPGGAHVQHLLHSYSKSRRGRRSGHVWFVKGGFIVEVSIRLPASFVELWGFTMWRSRLLDRIISIPSKSVGDYVHR